MAVGPGLFAGTVPITAAAGAGIAIRWDGSDGSGRFESLTFTNPITFQGAPTITVDRLGTTFAPTWTTAANKTIILDQSLGNITFQGDKTATRSRSIITTITGCRLSINGSLSVNQFTDRFQRSATATPNSGNVIQGVDRGQLPDHRDRQPGPKTGASGR